jgi:hypothetical protein
MKYSFTKITNFENTADLKIEWRDLHKFSTNPSIYNSYEFVISSLNNFIVKGSVPFILLIRNEEKLVGIFYNENNFERFMGINLRVCENTAQQEIDKPYPVIHKDSQDLVWSNYFSYLLQNKDWDIFRLYELDVRLQGVVLKNIPKEKMIIRVNEDKEGPTINLMQNWGDYLKSHKKMRKKISVITAKNNGNIDFKVFKNSYDALETYKEIESNSWKHGNIGINKNDATLSFYKDLLGRISQNPDLSIMVGVLYVDGVPISGEIAYTCSDKVYFCHGCYDKSYSNYSPGMISTAYFIKYFMDGNYSIGDFLCGYADYLKAWSDQLVKTDRVEIYNKTIAVRLFFLLRGLRAVLSFLRIKTSK